jgi:RNA polymerase sigma-70 factor (ECF subfamily)
MTESFPNAKRTLEHSLEISGGSSGRAHFTAADDASLLERVRCKDQKAMVDLFDRYGSMVYSLALRVLKDPANAEDLIQDVFFQLWENPRAFTPGRGSLAAWLLVVARNRAVDVLRHRRPTDSVDEVVLIAKTDVALEAERHTIMEKVRFALKRLPIEQQQSVEMAFFEGLSHSEIAARTGDPLGTVKTRIRMALTSVRKAFQE